MILENQVSVPASPAEVFALINDVERVVGCLPGASIDGRDGETYRGRVKVKVGPITAGYAGVVRFLEVDPERRRLRLQARGSDAHGAGDAEAEVVVTVADAPDGALLRLTTDLLIRGKIAQFGKGAIGTVSDKLLRQFAANLADLLTAPPGPAPVPAAAAPTPESATPELDGLSMLLGPLAKHLPVVGAFVLGAVQGWLLATLRSQSKQLKEARRVRRADR
ncbi:SRPBCC family protein [Saccharothrix deserti]|uniref:SRPBCC family protein n=1 Tax=Saccharothrix deserti TaxID=2593674 RepID=UPI00131D60E6|nr:SRPBCC family protein [Saccharothrix deserti]